jgi:Outer membrane lipoprotein carrier protein LolA-like
MCAMGAIAMLAIAAADIAGAAASQAPFDIKQLMRVLAAAPKTAIAFTETRHSSLLKAPLVTTGELRFSPPDTLERRVDAPFAERYRIDGDQMTIERAGSVAPRTLSLASQPLLANLVDTIRAMLRGDLPTLARLYRIELSGDHDDWALTLLPSDPAMVEYVASVHVTGHGGVLARMEVVEPNGDRTVTRFARAPEASR